MSCNQYHNPDTIDSTIDHTAAQGETSGDVHGEGALGLRICVRTYRLFYVAGTEDVLWRLTLPEQAEEAARRRTAYIDRRKAWLENFLVRENEKEKESDVGVLASARTPTPASLPEIRSPQETQPSGNATALTPILTQGS